MRAARVSSKTSVRRTFLNIIERILLFVTTVICYIDEEPLVRNGRCFERKRRGKEDKMRIDNAWVVPYNPYLCLKYNAHINVECCNSIKCLVYVTKHVNKGSDRIIYSKSDGKPVNEIRNYRDAWYVNANEATWRIFNFHIHKSYPPVTYLPIHLEGEHNIFYVEEKASMSVEHQLTKVTQLMAFFKLCENDVFARTLLYTEVPTHYVFCKKSGVWTERSRGSISIGRMQTTNSKNAELFYLRLMLSHVRGPKSFSDIRTVEGVEYATYREAVKAMRLIKDKDHWEKTLMEIVNHTNNGKDLRSTYATILVFCDLEDQSKVWLDIRDYYASDFLYKSGKTHYNEEIYLDALNEIQEYVYNCGGVDITKYGLPASRGLEKSFNLLRREKSYNTVQLIEDVREKLPMLNKEQREIFDAVIGVVGGKDRGKGKGFFIDAPGGTGKSFLLNLLLDAVRSKRGIALAVASSGIAATVLHGGRTAHNMFKIPLMESHKLRSCSIKKNTQMSKLLGMCSLIVWDEVVMANKNMLLAVDITLRDLLSANEFMGGIPFVCAGDFRQILPVVKGGGSNQEISATIKNTYFWEELRKYALTENLRLRGPDEHGHNKIFAECLLQIGDAASGPLAIPDNFGVVYYDPKEFINNVYQDLIDHVGDHRYFSSRVIISPLNVDVTEINKVIQICFLEQKSVSERR
ncbi:uncharacterized protein LOC143034293 [Oratosquilla oratoria]|uniref:uncharacterized protein LOC143034293 n=1 Tax=Oratosquilla oratoria TaxID=337810 RepID=UPI003F759F42